MSYPTGCDIRLRTRARRRSLAFSWGLASATIICANCPSHHSQNSRMPIFSKFLVQRCFSHFLAFSRFQIKDGILTVQSKTANLHTIHTNHHFLHLWSFVGFTGSSLGDHDTARYYYTCSSISALGDHEAKPL
jgi:hypothetical protein